MAIGRRLYRLLRDMVVQWMKESAIRDPDPDLVAQGLWAVVYGSTSLAAIDNFPWMGRTELAEYVVDVQLRGLAG